MTFPPLDPLSWIPDATKHEIFDGLIKFLMDKAGNTLGGEFAGVLGKLKSDAAFQDAVDAGLKRATDRFLREYADEDEDLTAALSADREFWKAKSVRDALLAILRQPGRWEDKDWETVASHFNDVLPQRRNRERVDRAVRFFLRCLAEEVWHLPELKPIYEMQMQRVSLERAEAMLHEVHGMRADFQQAMLSLMQGMAEQQKLLAGGTRPALPEPPKVYHNLPTPDYIRFVGREKELAELRRLLAPDHRIGVIVIDGIGGIGKSALALEIAHRYLREFDQLPEQERFQAVIWASAKAAVLTADGIAPRQQITRTLDDIYTTIAIALQREDITRARSEEQDELVCRALARQRTLLIIDNMETIDDERVNAFLREVPAPTKCIVTTRHRIDVAYPIRLTEMSCDDALSLITQECEKKAVMLSGEEADLLYRRTGGVPLAIVWSIAQMGYGYGAETVLHQLGNAQGDIARYCFEGALDHVRGKPADRLLMALAMFATDAGRDALGNVADLSKMDRDEGLVECERLSLLNKRADRFMMLPLTREYIRAKLTKGWETRARGRQADYLDGFLAKLHEEGGYYKSIGSFALERDNLLDCLEYLWAESLYEDFVRLALKSEFFLWVSGDWRAWRRILERAYHVGVLQDDLEAQAEFAYCLAKLEFFAGDFGQALIYARKAEDLFAKQDKISYARALVRTGWILSDQGDLDAAEAKYRHALNILPHTGTEWEVSRAQRSLGWIALKKGDFKSAREHLEISRALRECEPYVSVGLAVDYRYLGQVALAEGNLAEAREHLDKSLAIAQQLKITQDIGEGKLVLAELEHQAGNSMLALQFAREALEAFQRLGMKPNVALAEALLQRISLSIDQSGRTKDSHTEV